LSDYNFAGGPVRKRCPIHVHHLDDLNIVVEVQCSRSLGTLPCYRTYFHGGVHVERTDSESFLAEPPTAVTQRHSAAIDQARLDVAHAGLEHRLRQVLQSNSV